MITALEAVVVDNEFQQVLGIINKRRAWASQVVNHEVLLCAWEIGTFVSRRIKTGGWGAKTVTELSEYLRTQEPGLRGFSRANIYNMVALYECYSSPDFLAYAAKLNLNHPPKEIVQPETGQMTVGTIVQPAVGQLPPFLNLTTYSNHIEILNRCKTVEERIFYVFYAWKERLNKRELQRCLKTGTYAALADKDKKLSKGLKTAYPQVSIFFKDQVFVDFLGLPEKHSEKRLKTGILDNMKDFILELGKDFLFIDKEYPLNVGGSIFKVDLLFFHRGLQCLVVIELKAADFKPEYIGQLEFYLEALDRDVKRSNENPSIGILLCRGANQSVVEYAMSRSLSPTMVAEYKRKLVPKEIFRKSLDEFGAFFASNKRVP